MKKIPAEKIEPGSEFPVNLDHYKCYRCLEGDTIAAFVTLEDQFGYEEVDVWEPIWFCNPVSKNYEGIISDVDHLVFYRFTPSTIYYPPIDIIASDQFGDYPIVVDSSIWLGVPSEKLYWEASTSVGEAEDEAPATSYALYQNVPNPFNPTTVIRFHVPSGGGDVTLKIYDVQGELVRTLVDGPRSEGTNQAVWHAQDSKGKRVASGVYFYRMTAPGFDMTRKMLLLQ